MFNVHLDAADILGLKDLEKQAKKVAEESTKHIAAQIHSHIVEQVNSKLTSSREQYIKALSFSEIDEDTFMINLDASAMWIEEGMPRHEMIEDLLKNGKTSKDGSQYAVIPFKHNVGPSKSTPAQKSLTDTVKKAFSDKKIPYGNLELDSQGNPKQGLLHKFDIKDLPKKSINGPGQGHGPIGAVRQGMGGTPLLQGIRVYQKQFTGPDGQVKTKKMIMTFRTVSSKHKGTGRWVHPGTQPKLFFEEAVEWAQKEFEDKIKDKIVLSIVKGI